LTKTLHAFGDSFIVADQDDFLHFHHPKVVPTHGMEWDQRLHYLKYTVSFVAILADHYGYDLNNYAERGSGNYPQLDRLWLNLTNGTITPGDIVLFGLTTTIRDRFALTDFEKSTSDKWGPCLIDRDLLSKSADRQRILELDFYYLLTILDRLSEQFNVKIIKFNLFDNALDLATDDIKHICKVKDFVGYDVAGNTLIDILNDTWGAGVAHSFAHQEVTVLPEHEHLYTVNRHPSIEGHKKIAKWWILNNIMST
jgi:hypothetical protein